MKDKRNPLYRYNGRIWEPLPRPNTLFQWRNELQCPHSMLKNWLKMNSTYKPAMVLPLLLASSLQQSSEQEFRSLIQVGEAQNRRPCEFTENSSPGKSRTPQVAHVKQSTWKQYSFVFMTKELFFNTSSQLWQWVSNSLQRKNGITCLLKDATLGNHWDPIIGY